MRKSKREVDRAWIERVNNRCPTCGKLIKPNAKSCIKHYQRFFKKGHKINFGRIWTEERNRNVSKSKLREKNPRWKGDGVKYRGLHTWIIRNWGRADRCECCGKTELKSYDWSNKKHNVSRKREDWQMLCRSCHLKYDYKENWTEKNNKNLDKKKK